MTGNYDQERITVVYDSIKYETENAYLLSFGDDFEAWIPKSISILNDKDNTIEIPLWLAEDKSIECYEE